MISNRTAAENKIKAIYKESVVKFNCLNFQFIAEQLKNELLNNISNTPPKNTNNNKRLNLIRNLQILQDVINGAEYRTLRSKYNLTSTAAIATIAKRTACKLDTEISNLINKENLPPKRVINNHGLYLGQIINNKLNQLKEG